MFTEVKILNKKTAIRLAIIAFVAVGMAIFTLLISVTRPKYSQFCAKCHSNISFNNACKKAPSLDIACIECHTHENKGMGVMAVEIEDEHCTTESCHPLRKLSAKTAQYKKITPFQHKTHTDKFTDNLKLRCTSCHSNLGGEKHFEIDTNTCNICHFINAQQPLYTKDKKPLSHCILCHSHIEKTMEIYGKTFDHKVYEGNEKVGCTDCHFRIIQGEGAINKESCYQCHPKVADNLNNASDMHYNHVVRHKTGCTPCHTSITHGWSNLWDNVNGNDSNPRLFSVNCTVQNLILAGRGGAGIEGKPDPMYLATLNCSACHKDEKLFANVAKEVCNNCHEKGFDKILSEQMHFVSSEMRLLKNLLTKAKRNRNINENPLIQEAERNYHLIKEDGSLGVHNIAYVKDILDYSIVNLKQLVQCSVKP
jgi:hypothetical protein